MGSSSCEDCAYYEYDDEYDYYYCDRNLDEDEMYKFLNSAFSACPYYSPYDEYKIARKQ